MSTLLGSLKSKISRKGSFNSRSRNADNSKLTAAGGNTQAANRNATAASPSSRVAGPRSNRSTRNAALSPPDEPPPAYSPTAPASSANVAAHASAGQPSTVAAQDDKYAFLRSFDTVFLVDDSGSMAGRSWRETGAALEVITPICTAHDSDGIDIYFLNAKDSSWYKNVTSSATVREIFSAVRPSGGTPTGQKLNQILKPYLQRYAAKPDTTKPLNIIVITDGEPSDDVESPIIAAAKKLDKLDAPAWQVGIQFFQVGREPGARQHLKQLDDDLAEIAGDDDLRDMVDTVPFLGDDDAQLTGEGIMKVVLGACNRRLDRNSRELHSR